MEKFDCSKCGKRLGFDGLNVLCVCVDCKKSFCVNEGTIFKNPDIYVSIAKGTNERIITDFFCYKCDGRTVVKPRPRFKTNEQIKTEATKEQDEKLAKAKEEKEQAELLRRQMLHGSRGLEINEKKSIELPKFQELSNVKIGFRGEFKPCSGYLN